MQAMPAQTDLGRLDGQGEEQAINTIDTVQPHGALLILRLPEWSITHASTSLQAIFGVEAQAVIGRPLTDLMSRHTIHRLRNIMQFVVANGEPERLMNLAMGFKRDRFDLSLYADQNRAIVEIKPRQPGRKNTEDALFLLRAMRARIRNASSPADVCARTARQCRSFSGYDSATVFRFREDGTSEVVADDRRGDGGPMLGLLYGAEETDMLARRLVTNVRFSYVPDCGYAPSTIVPGPAPEGDLHGLNALGLRCLEPELAAYLQQSGAGAIFALPIGPLEAPWGAVVCQSSEPRFIPFEIRSALEFFTNGIALQVALLGAAETFSLHAAARKTRANILADRAMEIDPAENLQGFANALAHHLAVDGIGYWNGEAFTAVGEAPSQQAASTLAAALDAQTPTVQTFDDLCAVGGLIDGEPGPGGMLAVRLARDPGHYLMIFRKVEVKRLHWARPRSGDEPREEIEMSRSHPWGRVEIEAGHALRSLIFDLRLRRTDRDDEGQAATLQRQEMVITELNHRIKNLLALFQSLIAKTGEGTETPEELASALAGRVRSLAFAHDQLNGDGVSSVPLRSLIEAELAPFISKDSKVEIDGPSVAFLPQAFSVLALVVHELATNAAKYGALSTAGGKLAVTWSRVEGGGVRLVWRETSAAPIVPPSRRGFGSTIVERMIPFELRGEANVNYPPEGLLASFDIPAQFVKELGVESFQKRRATTSTILISDKSLRALVVEDNMIIALQAEDMLRRMGFSYVDVASRWQDAATLLDRDAFDVVALDVDLGGETSFPLADRLSDKGVPFFFATGYGERNVIPDRFAHVPIVAKPYSDASLSAAVSEFLGKVS